MYMSESDNKRFNLAPIQLISHTVAHFVVVVPYVGSTSSSVGQILYDSPIFNIWCASVVSFIIVRLCIRRCMFIKICLNEISYIPFNTIGLSFGTTSAKSVRNRSENLVVLFIEVSSIFTGVFCSGILLQSFVGSSNRPIINSLADLDKLSSFQFVSNKYVLAHLMYYFINQS